MGYQLRRDDIDGKYKNIFSKTQEDKDALFVYGDARYNLTVKDHEDEGIEICGEKILGDEEIKLDDFVTESKIVNFNKVDKIESDAFSNLFNSTDDVIFKFKSEEVKIMPRAFGSKFEKLSGIEGLEGQLSVIMYHDSFVNEGVLNNIKFKDTDIYLEGEWNKTEIEKLLNLEYDGGKIRNGKSFKIGEEDLFADDELDDSKLDKLNKELADKISLNKESTKTKKENISKKKKEDKAKAKAEGKDIKEELTWNKVDGKTQEEIVKAIINEFNNLDVFARIELDEKKVELTDSGEIKIVKDSISKISFIGDTVEATKKVFERYHESIKLKNNKANKDKARDMAKKMIEDDFIVRETVLGEENIEGLEGIACKFIINIEELKKSDKFKGEEIKLGNNIEETGTNEISNFSSAKEVLNKLEASFKGDNDNKEEVFLSKVEYGRLLMSIQLIANEYKNRKDEAGRNIYKKCIESVKTLKKSKIIKVSEKEGE